MRSRFLSLPSSRKTNYRGASHKSEIHYCYILAFLSVQCQMKNKKTGNLLLRIQPFWISMSQGPNQTKTKMKCDSIQNNTSSRIDTVTPKMIPDQ